LVGPGPGPGQNRGPWSIGFAVSGRERILVCHAEVAAKVGVE
jgi:hypothetical protein